MGTTLNLGMVADMKVDPRLERFSIWGRPILGEGGGFGLPSLPERREVEWKLEMPRGPKVEVGKGKGKGREARRDGCGFDKYRELPSVAAHSPWCARNDDTAEFARYRELPSVHAHEAWCARTRIGDDDGVGEDRDGAEGYTFERYRELPSVFAHGAWSARSEDEVEDGGEEEEEDKD